MRRTLLAAAALATMTLPANALGHVSFHPNTLPASSNPTLNVRVPNEESNASVVKVDMQIPPGFLDISTQLPSGWKATVLKRKLATPVKTDAGTITEDVSEVIWSAPKAAGIPPGSFLQFPISTAVPDGDAGQTLTFKVIQTYSNGDVVRWIEAPNSMMHPAPTVNITPAGGVLLDAAGTEAGPGPVPANATAIAPASRTPAAASPAKRASQALGIAALVVGALALLLALGAVASARGRRT